MKQPKKELKRQIVALKIGASDLQKIFAKAIKYTDGNISAYLREAALNYKRGGGA